ncbi:MAG: ABC transporter substrate-binding protein [Catenibacillus sp.]
MKMKKLLATLLASSMVLSLAACGGGNSGNSETKTPAGETQAAAETEAASETQAGEADSEASADNSQPEGEIEEGGTFVVSVGGDPSSFNPDYKSDDNLWPIAQNMYNRLFKLTADSKIVPDLATSYEFSEDGKTLTCHLAEGVKWHDGEPFTSEDVKWTYDTAIEQNWFKATSLSSVESIECPDENTVVFNLKAADVTIVSKLGWYGTFILPKHLYEGQDPATCDAALKNPVGTGPFKFESYETGVGVTLVRNDDFWGDKPHLDKVIFAVYADPDSAYQAFLNGEVDYLGTGVPTANVGELDEDENYRVFNALWINRTYITFNFADPDFGKPEVRKAVQLAVDRQGIFDRVGGAGARSDTYVSPLLTDYVDETYVQPERNVEEAMKLMEEAGYTKDADGYYLHATMDVFESDNFGDMAQIIKANLAEAGIDLTINMMEYAAWVEKVNQNHNFTITMLAGYQGPDVSGLAGRIRTGESSNVGGYSNARVDELFALSDSESDTAKRAEYYSEIQKIMSEEVPMVLLLDNGTKFPVPNNIVGSPYDVTDKCASEEFTYVGFLAQ